MGSHMRSHMGSHMGAHLQAHVRRLVQALRAQLSLGPEGHPQALQLGVQQQLMLLACSE
jgi:hypothetical protein